MDSAIKCKLDLFPSLHFGYYFENIKTTVNRTKALPLVCFTGSNRYGKVQLKRLRSIIKCKGLCKWKR